MIPGCSVIRSASSTSRLAAEDNDRPGFAATGGSNLTGVAGHTGEVDAGDCDAGDPGAAH